MASRPDGDVWNIVDNDKDSQHYGRNFKFDFSYISSEEIKDVVKDYVWQNYRHQNRSLSSIYNYVCISSIIILFNTICLDYSAWNIPSSRIYNNNYDG